jgi:F1F0 ATPase subunit 2
MTMNDAFTLALAGMAGTLLGILFFGGLLWTVQRGLCSAWPGATFLGSFLVRTGLVLAGFWFVSEGHWGRLLTCLLGFLVARVLVQRLSGLTATRTGSPMMEAHRAP